MSNSVSPQSYSAHGSAEASGPPRKKMRKGTKSCIECRRRKIRCTFEEGRTSICNECFARGSTCIDQEHADAISFTNPPSVLQQKDDQNAVLKDRVTYLEDLVKQVLERLPEKNGTATATVTPPSSTEDRSSIQADAQAGRSNSRPREGACRLRMSIHLFIYCSNLEAMLTGSLQRRC